MISRGLGPVVNQEAIEGHNTTLHCDSAVESAADELMLLVWYKNDAPIYSYDARSRSEWSSESFNTTGRLKANISQQPTTLTVSALREDDQELYHCRAALRPGSAGTPGRPWWTHLTEPATSLGPHGEPDISVPIKEGGNEVQNQKIPINKIHHLHWQDKSGSLSNLDSPIPAYNVSIHWVEGTLGDTLQAGKPALVQCSAHGSYPPADLAWWLDHKHLTQHSNQSFVNATGTAISFLQLTPGVADAGATLACVATNPAMAPSRGSKADIITLNVTCKYGVGLYLTESMADTGATLACVATNPAMAPSRGSKADIITLNVTCKYGVELLRQQSVADTGATLACIATLNDTCTPIVEVSLLGDESPNEVVELDPLHLKCDVKANPPVDRFKWYFNDNEIHAGDIWGFNTTSGELVVEEATRHHAGRYNCAAGNSVGQTTAEHISVTVFYPPECDNGITLIKETVNCNVRALPTPDTYFWHIQPSGSDMQHLTTGSALLPLSQVTGPLPGTLKVTCDAGNGIASQETPCERILSLEHLRPQQPQQCDLAYEYEEFQMRCIPVLLEKDVAISVGAVVLVAAFLISTFLVVRLARRSRAKPSAPVIQVLQLDDIARDYLDTIGENCDDCTLASSCNAINDLISSKESAASNQLKEAFCGFDNHNLPKVCCSMLSNAELEGRNPGVDSIEGHPNLQLLPETCEQRLAGVRIGEFDLESAADCRGMEPHLMCEDPIQDLTIEEAIVHPDYRRNPTFNNDIGMLRLKKPVNLTFENAKTICLPVSKDLQNRNASGINATIAGWGISDIGYLHATPRATNIQIYTQNQCIDSYIWTEKDIEFTNKLCAGTNGRLNRIADDGGPLMVEGSNNGSYRFIQYGINSFTISRRDSVVPTVYTDRHPLAVDVGVDVVFTDAYADQLPADHAMGRRQHVAVVHYWPYFRPCTWICDSHVCCGGTPWQSMSVSMSCSPTRTPTSCRPTTQWAAYDDDDQPHDDQFYDDQPYGHQIDDTNTSEPHTRQYITKRGRITSIPINGSSEVESGGRGVELTLLSGAEAGGAQAGGAERRQGGNGATTSRVEVVESVEGHPNLSLLPNNCGILDGNKIVGGRVAGLYEYPWMVLLSYRTNGRSGGALNAGVERGVLLIERPQRRLRTRQSAPHHFQDLEKSCQVYITKEHTDIINSIDGMGGNTSNCGAPEIVTGSRDGTVKVWDPRQRGKPVANMQPVKGETRRDCWTVNFGNSFNDAERIVTAGYDNGDLKMFDLRTMSLRWECNLKNGLENDMENYVQYKIMGSVKRIRMKPSCIPSKFVRKRKHNPTPDEKQHDSKNRAAMPSSEDSMEMSTSCFHQEYHNQDKEKS
ncbi:hypothetical protein MSG28_007055 [Choristoneura fumiferana]|uniref:Uncharacterized protein n=1 Tax=Choristoneura fumiferana TaxID=7141 RepID=A0ACC0JMG4_CHOFU|nr:hypothetical protein MSG28_007055 [Choristoneura fumiferana]